MNGKPVGVGEEGAEPTQWVRAAVAHVDTRSDGPPMDRALRVTLNFHPDRLAGGGLTIEALVRDGVYRSQFETGTSAGGLTAYPGGDRWRWEQRLFGGAYDDAPDAERPKYGALDDARRPLGAAPRFGSAHLRLREHVLDRTTFCFPDSYLDPDDLGTAAHLDLVRLAREFRSVPRDPVVEPRDGDLLDGYVEAHVHGVVDLARDVEELVLDPSFRGTPVEEAARSAPVPLRWHEGRVLTLEELRRHAHYRGPEPVALGHLVAVDGRLDARVIGDAARTGVHHPQLVKQIWHLTARYGAPGEA